MTRFSALAVALTLVFPIVALCGCKEEPTIVIKFEPNDMSGARAATATKDGGPPAADLATAPATESKAETKKDKVGKKAAAECKVAADCVVEPADCCDCANGGKQHAIPKKQAAASKAARAERCKHTMCTMMLSTDPTCGERPDCVDGQCVMVKKAKKK